LTKSSSQTFNEKVNLIYEYNKQSPLFVRVANNEMEKNNPERAVEILNEGLLKYPDYPIAHILYGKALMMLGKYKESLDSFRKGSELVNSHKVYEYYLHEVENLKKQRIFLDKSDKEGSSKEDENENSEEMKKINLEEELSSFDLMDEQKAKPSSLKTGNDSIISETLANIYLTQGEFREALSVYEKLSDKNPQKKDYYLQKINEIKAELE
jgi:tetratricopeptide (TPR) repeat protein